MDIGKQTRVIRVEPLEMELPDREPATGAGTGDPAADEVIEAVTAEAHGTRRHRHRPAHGRRMHRHTD